MLKSRVPSVDHGGTPRVNSENYWSLNWFLFLANEYLSNVLSVLKTFLEIHRHEVWRLEDHDWKYQKILRDPRVLHRHNFLILVKFYICQLTLIWVGYLGVCFEVRGKGRVKLPPPSLLRPSKSRYNYDRNFKFGT